MYVGPIGTKFSDSTDDSCRPLPPRTRWNRRSYRSTLWRSVTWSWWAMVLDHPPCPHCGEGPKHWGSPPLWRMSLRPMDLPSADHVRMFDWDDSVPMTLGVSGLRGWVETMICDWKGTESCDSSSKGRWCWCYCWCCCCDPLRYYCSLGGWSRSLDWWVRTAVDFAEAGRDADVRYWYRQYDSIRHSSSWYESHHPWWWRFLVGDNVVVMERSPSFVMCWYSNVGWAQRGARQRPTPVQDAMWTTFDAPQQIKSQRGNV